MSYFRNKNALVTGGASGIGFALCRRLSDEGANVLLTDIDEGAASRAAEKLGSRWRILDVTDPKAFRACVEQFAAESGPLDILFNNAGLVATGEAHTFDYDDWKRIIDVNVYGVVNGVYAAYAGMVERRSGQIVNTASVAGLFPSAGQASYTTSKYAVVGLSHALRIEAMEYNVKVNVVCPGIIKTPMRDNLEIKGDFGERVLGILPEGMDVDECAKQILRGVAKDEPTIVVTPMAQALWRLNRLSPELTHWFAGRLVNWLKGR